MSESQSGVYEVMRAAEQLKAVPRLGWIISARIRRPESVADHSYAVAVSSMVIADYYGLDACRMMKMALLHDLCESLTGDMQPGDTTESRKHQAERKALAAILSELPAKVRDSYLEIFDEFNDSKTLEAELVHQIDKLEMAAQAVVYKKQGYSNLEQFFDTAERKVTSSKLRPIMRRLRSK